METPAWVKPAGPANYSNTPHSAAAVGVLGLPVFIQAKAEAPPTGFVDRGKECRLRASWAGRPCDLLSLPALPPPAAGELLWLMLRFDSQRITFVAPPTPFSPEVPPTAPWLFRRLSMLERGGGGGSYEAPVRADDGAEDFGFRTFMVLPRPAGW